jgi:hypothetical protein
MRTLIVAFCCTLSISAMAGSTALSTKDLDDEIRASLVKEMSKAKQFKDDGRRPGGTSGKGEDDEDERSNRRGSNNGCKVDVGNVEKPAPGTRRVVTVVTGNVVQVCK